jgi:photosystem II stability/assembly factor-like uncharacterized protein
MRNPDRIKLAAAVFSVGIAIGLSACGGSSSGGPVIDPPSPPPAPDAPLGIQVVAGDGNNSDSQNTISWFLDPSATDYTVYWSNTPGVTLASNVLVPSAQGTRYAIHSDVDVVAGTTYYYRVEAASTGGASALSAEVQGTPQQSITNSSLNDVAWNGVDNLVAVGDNGTILNSPNGLADGWSDVSTRDAPQSLSAVTWEGVNSQFVIVGAGSTVLTGDGTTWVREDLSNFQGALNLEDIAWLGDRYIAVGNSGSIITSNADGSGWIAQDAGAGVANTALNAVATDSQLIVVVGTNGTILSSADGIAWTELAKPTNNDLNDITWDGDQFVVVGSNDTILTSPDGATWTSHVPGTSDINFVAVTHWDSGLPQNPVLGTVGSSGTYVVEPDADPGMIIRTGTTEQLGGMTWVDDGVAPAYFVIVGNDGTVLTTHYQ